MKANYGLKWAWAKPQCQNTNNGPMAKYKSQQWAEKGLGLKQYHKGQTWV
jgi:hypothetical protein